MTSSEVLFKVKTRMDLQMNNALCEMKPGYDDSITGFNEAWDIVLKILAEEIARAELDGDLP